MSIKLNKPSIIDGEEGEVKIIEGDTLLFEANCSVEDLPGIKHSEIYMFSEKKMTKQKFKDWFLKNYIIDLYEINSKKSIGCLSNIEKSKDQITIKWRWDTENILHGHYSVMAKVELKQKKIKIPDEIEIHKKNLEIAGSAAISPGIE